MSIDQYKKSGTMNLKTLIEEREHISAKPFLVDDDELLYRFEQLYTGDVKDVLLRAGEINKNEKKIFGWVHAGDTTWGIMEKDGCF